MKRIILGILGSRGFMGSCTLQWALHHPLIGEVFGWCRADGEEARQQLFKHTDIVIDFSHNEARQLHIELALANQTPLFIGTTGLGLNPRDYLHPGILPHKDTQYPHKITLQTAIMQAPNASLGMAWMLAAIKTLSPIYPHIFSATITERHHVRKRDAPSGTALALKTLFTSPPPPIISIREGECVGEHTVTYERAGETLTLTHKATDRQIFAHGALAAALWLKDQLAGFYTFSDFIDATLAPSQPLDHILPQP